MIEAFFASIDASDLAEHLQSQQGIETAQLVRMKEWQATLTSMERKARYRAKNRALLRHKQGMRRAAKLNAIPPWLTKTQERQILRLHEKAVEREFWSQIPHDLHHSSPLCGKSSASDDVAACGLHVPWNLEVLTREENLSLGARLDGDSSIPF
ncbi:hypothetical protein SAMN04487859_103225 [Roseovarius lutimaris]|uniref:Uncharacterized protein n=1 Tax=Roseovarius lutimaris TaxID=1005928 RepID=A0A1I4ZHE6_9RHOB|nr:hypothetical protein [Roseovarius lutimaris]SFN49628.1 hypothetical protein SAMN04487859_103225 [Roseovarius lutimaris]